MHPPPSHIQCSGGITEALLWFHLTRQLREGIKPDGYSITEVTITADRAAPRWLGSELPPICHLDRVTITKAMFKVFKTEVQEAQKRGLVINVA